MRHDMDDLDRALTEDDALVPSSGFAARVMEAVQDDAAEPPPLAFPWRPFAIGVVACLVWAASTIQLMKRVDVQGVTAQFVDAGPLPLYGAAIALAATIVLGLRQTLLRR